MLTRRMPKIAILILCLACLADCIHPATPQPTLTLAPSLTAAAPTLTAAPTTAPIPTPTLAPCPPIPGQKPCALDVKVPVSSTATITTRVHFLLYLPGDYGKDPQKKWPLILFLHGSGNIGSDLNMLKQAALPAILETQTDFPFIVISPQLPGSQPFTTQAATMQIQYWSGMIEPLNILLDQVIASYSVDSHRLYLTGLSLGGFGTWEFALRYPQRFSAIVPVAGGYQFQSDAIPAGICDLKNLPVWVFHGGQDTNVLPKQDQSLVKALQDCGGNVRFTFYPDANHAQTWQRAYADAELWKWLLEQTK